MSSVGGTPSEAAGSVPSGEPDSADVGTRLRELRTGRRMTLKAVADRAGISEGFLSQIERGRSAPSLRTFQRIAHALGLEPGDILRDGGAELPRLVRRAEARATQIGSLSKFQITPQVVTTVEVIRGTFEPGGTAGVPYTHGDSDEVFVVVDGSVRAEVDGRAFDLHEGDSLCYRSSMTHTFHNLGDGPAEVLWIISPPSW